MTVRVMATIIVRGGYMACIYPLSPVTVRVMLRVRISATFIRLRARVRVCVKVRVTNIIRVRVRAGVHYCGVRGPAKR